MILTLHTEMVIDSAHCLKGYKGICKRVHGHTWKVELFFRGAESCKDPVGILVDFGITKKLKHTLDHRFINDVIGKNPTAENLTAWIYQWLRKRIDKNIAVQVKVFETAIGKETWCEGGDFDGYEMD